MPGQPITKKCRDQTQSLELDFLRVNSRSCTCRSANAQHKQESRFSRYENMQSCACMDGHRALEDQRVMKMAASFLIMSSPLPQEGGSPKWSQSMGDG
eukprot:12400916-Karenia_brevis.AAC.1